MPVNFESEALYNRLTHEGKIEVIRWCYRHRDAYADRAAVKRRQFWYNLRLWILKRLQTNVVKPDALVRRLETKRRLRLDVLERDDPEWVEAMDQWLAFLDRLEHGQLLPEDLEPARYRRKEEGQLDEAEMGVNNKYYNEAEMEMIGHVQEHKAEDEMMRHIREHEEEAARARRREEEMRQQLQIKYERTERWVADQELRYRDVIKRSFEQMNAGNDGYVEYLAPPPPPQQQEGEAEDYNNHTPCPVPVGDEGPARKRLKVEQQSPRDAATPNDYYNDNNGNDSGVAGLSLRGQQERDKFMEVFGGFMEALEKTKPMIEKMAQKVDALEQKVSQLSEAMYSFFDKGSGPRRSSRLQA